MKPLIHLVAPYWLYLAAGVACLVLMIGGQLFIPYYFGTTVDAIIDTNSLTVLNTRALALLATFLARSILLYGQSLVGYFLSHRITADIRQRLVEQLHRWSLDRFSRLTSGDLIARSLQDTQVVQTTLFTGLLDFVGTILILAGTVVMLFILHWRLALFTIVVIPLLLGSARAFGNEIQHVSVRAQERIADLASLLRQVFAGARVIRAFAQEDREVSRFRLQNERTYRENLRVSQLIAAQVPVVSLLTALGLLAVLWQGGQLVANHTITAGMFVAFIAYAALAVEPAITLSRFYGSMRQGLGALERILELLRMPEGVGDAPLATSLPAIRGQVTIQNVSFSYDGTQWALVDISLLARPGERVALVGPSGAGKTTLINLIPRFYDPTKGTIAIDGHELRSVTLRSLREQIGLVPQETFLFQGTVRENIAYARPDASDEAIISAARVANAHEFISALPLGYQTALGEDGMQQLSSGQRQRLAIARALLNDPRIIILDEATSALDMESEYLIQEALDRLMEGRTTFIIAHRLSTVRKADRIVVLEAGRIVEMGSHAQLVAADGLYARIARLQFEEAGLGRS